MTAVTAVTAPAAPRIVVAGYGNPLRGDDGAGWRVAAALQARWEPPGDDVAGEPSGAVTVLAGQQPLPEWASALAGADIAYFVDASPDAFFAGAADDADGARAGWDRVQVTPVGAGAAVSSGDSDAALLDGHAVGPEGLLALTRALYGRAPAAFLVTVPAGQFGFTEQLSAQTAAAVHEATALLDRLLAEHLGSPVTAPAETVRAAGAAGEREAAACA